MERIPERELTQHTSAVLARVANGESIEVTVSGRPVARLVPIARSSALDDLIAAGRIIPATNHTPFRMPTVKAEPGADAGELLSSLRDEERW
jgi:prevent-host-death family protein